MEYKIKITESAVEQLKEAVGYISKVLLVPLVARSWSDRIKKEILSLSYMPFRYPLVDEEPWRAEGIRKMTVENFLVYYFVNEDTNTVWITAIVYDRRDQLSVLRNMPKE